MGEGRATAQTAADARCLRCDATLEPVQNDGYPWQTYGGCIVEVVGNYGSRVLDPPFGNATERLYGVMCDECVTASLPRLFAVARTRPPMPTWRRVDSWEQYDNPRASQAQPERAEKGGGAAGGVAGCR